MEVLVRRALNVICFISYILYLSACGSSGGAAADAQAAPTPTPGITPPPSSGGTTVAATYYTKVQNATVNHAGSTYAITMTGHCVSYASNDYCWDDGWQTIPAFAGFETNFWGFCELAGVIGQCSGGGSTDPVTAPTLWTATFSGVAFPLHSPAEIYASGVATPVTCTISGSLVDCVDFQIDVAQTPR